MSTLLYANACRQLTRCSVDAEPELISEYITALIRGDKSENDDERAKHFASELTAFLSESTGNCDVL